MSERTIITRETAKEWATEGFSEYVIDNWTKDLVGEYGLGRVQILYSGFWSQGDGASFTAVVDDRWKFLEKLMAPEAWLEFEAKLALHDDPEVTSFVLDTHYGVVRPRNGNYVHECSVVGEVTLASYYDADGNEHAEELADELGLPTEEEITTFIRGLCRQIYKDLEAEYDYCTSDEQLLEMAEANDWIIVGLNDSKEEEHGNAE